MSITEHQPLRVVRKRVTQELNSQRPDRPLLATDEFPIETDLTKMDILFVDDHPNHIEMSVNAVHHLSDKRAGVVQTPHQAHAILSHPDSKVNMLGIDVDPQNPGIAEMFAFSILASPNVAPFIVFLAQDEPHVLRNAQKAFRATFPNQAEKIHVIDKSETPRTLPKLIDAAFQVTPPQHRRSSLDILKEKIAKLRSNKTLPKYQTTTLPALKQ